ncbi:MAG: ThiF family adenylyltransferase [Gammaproteobacteria bacterium]|nr:ThiF family adenylyltransferase [Gammaproteobacteria bacterium]
MSQSPISRSEDLRRLREEGYDIEIRSSYLLVKDVPYVNSGREIKRAILVSSLNLAGDITSRPDDHTIRFAGEFPCRADGSPMNELVNASDTTRLDDGLVINHSFSRKPPRGHYENYHEKMTTYVALLSSQAQAIDPNVTARTFRVEEPEDASSPFNYIDTASGRAEISVVTSKLMLDRIAIIGLGGTGAYVLDLTAKTPVREIHLFDGDKLSTHNAFRSPGASSIEELRQQPFKTEYFKGKYSPMHKGIIAHNYYISSSSVDELRGMAFVFLCIDRGEEKQAIMAKLEEFGIPFIDVGMGVYLKNETLIGTVTVTTSTPSQRGHVKNRVSFSSGDAENEYDTNIQIADLNALNATLAVIRWKKLFGFYADFENEHFSAYTIESNLLIGEDAP